MTASIAVSFLVMIIAVSISSGFRHEIRDGISSLTGDIRLTPPDLNVLDEPSPIARNPAYIGPVLEMPGVKEVVPAVYKAGIIKNGDNIHGVLFKGTPGGASAAGPEVGDSIPLAVSIICIR